jgi:hypothetical protein
MSIRQNVKNAEIDLKIWNRFSVLYWLPMYHSGYGILSLFAAGPGWHPGAT